MPSCCGGEGSDAKGVCASICVERACSACVSCGLSARGPVDLGIFPTFRPCAVRNGEALAGKVMRGCGCR